jgi:hypothetical protein
MGLSLSGAAPSKVMLPERLKLQLEIIRSDEQEEAAFAVLGSFLAKRDEEFPAHTYVAAHRIPADQEPLDLKEASKKHCFYLLYWFMQ